MKDKEKAQCLYEQISEFGQTPFQMFKKNSHPEKKVIKVEKRLHEIAMKVEFKILCKNPASIIYFYPASEELFKIILKNNDVVEFDSTNRKEKEMMPNFCFNINIDDCSMKPLNNSQIYVLNKNPNILIIGGYPDNSFKIYNNQKEKQQSSCYFHRKIITCLDVSEKLGLIACGSKDYKVSLWRLDMKSFKVTSADPIHIFYGHQNEVTVLSLNDCLEILVTVDKNNVCLMHSLKSRKFLNKIEIKLEDNDSIKLLKIHSNGLLLACSKKNTLFLFKYFQIFYFFLNSFSLNGELLKKKKNFIDLGYITHIKFYSNLFADFVISYFYNFVKVF